MNISTFRIDWKSPITIISLLSILGGITYIVYPSIIQYGMYSSPITTIWHRALQFLLYSLLHGGLLHTLSNIIFFLFIGKIVEITHGRKYVWGLWIWTTLFVGGILMFLGAIISYIHFMDYIAIIIIRYAYFILPYIDSLSSFFVQNIPTIGGSGFAMALLSVYTLDFYRRGNPEYKGGIMLIILNIGVGLYGNISLLGHLAGAIAGFLYGIFFKKY